jgi:hypothetical protein
MLPRGKADFDFYPVIQQQGTSFSLGEAIRNTMKQIIIVAVLSASVAFTPFAFACRQLADDLATLGALCQRGHIAACFKVNAMMEQKNSEQVGLVNTIDKGETGHRAIRAVPMPTMSVELGQPSR